MSGARGARVPRIGIAGARGHGATHVAAARELEASGAAVLAAVADHSAARSGVATDGVRVFTEAEEMIAAADLDVVVLSTPMHTHVPLALAALDVGAHVLLEKPPTPTLDDFHRLTAAAGRARGGVQVGFQSLGSDAVPFVRRLIADGAIGDVVRYGVLGLWVRTEAYWTRTAWAGRRTLDGRPVVDGAVANPLAHATATALAIAGAGREADVTGVRLDLHRANAIEADDTSSFVVDLAGGGTLAGALVLTAPRHGEPCVIVQGTAGRIVLWYTLDLVQVETPATSLAWTTAHGRTDLLANLVDHATTDAPLLVPLADTGGFMRVLEAVRTAEDPAPIDRAYVSRVDDDEGVHLVVDGVERWSERVVAEGRTFREVGAPWA